MHARWFRRTQYILWWLGKHEKVPLYQQANVVLVKSFGRDLRNIGERALRDVGRAWRETQGRARVAPPQQSFSPSSEKLHDIIHQDARKALNFLRSTFGGGKRNSTGGWFGDPASEVTSRLIAANIAVFGLWHLAGPRVKNTRTGVIHDSGGLINQTLMLNHFCCSNKNIKAGRIHTLATCAFSHNRFAHLFVNMLMLFMYGKLLEPTIGRSNLMILYMVSGICGALVNCLFSKYDLPCLGASAADCGLMAMATCLYPRMTVLLFGLVPMPMYVTLLLLTSYSIIYSRRNESNISHAGHLGGLIGGTILGYRYKALGKLF